MSQMIVRYTVADYAKFRAAFDDDAGDRGRAGMALLQLWRENDATLWALYQVSDTKAATDYAGGRTSVFASLAGVNASEFHLVETA